MEEVMKKMALLLGMLVMVLVFGMMVSGCVMLEAMASSNEARKSDGIGGDVVIKNTSNRDYWVQVHENDSLGNYDIQTTRIRAGESKREIFLKDSEYVIRYGIVEQKDQDFGFVNVPVEQIRNWNIRRGYISNDETITVDIPYFP